MVFFRILVSISAFYGLAGAVFAQDFQTDIQTDSTRAAGVYHSYEFGEIHDTPAPKGYKPFYISHYGRHGSRRHLGRAAEEAYKYMEAAREAGILTEEGLRLSDDVRTIHAQYEGMTGELSIQGGKEHATLARRMYARFPQAFRGRGRMEVYCQASTIPRCLLSMAFFTGALKDEAPRLQFDYITGEKYLEMLSHDYYDRESYRPAQVEIVDSILRARIDPSRIMKAWFKEGPETDAVISNPYRIMYYAFLYAAGCQDIRYEVEMDLFPYFTEEEQIALYTYLNDRIYSSYGNSLEFGDHITWAAQWCLRDIVERADKALEARSSMVADLRFGHDSGLLPLAALMGLGEVGARYPVADAHLYYPTWKYIPMASNLQLIFYRNRQGDILVKALYNERETAIEAVPAFEGPYYRWKDVRTRFLHLCDEKAAQK